MESKGGVVTFSNLFLRRRDAFQAENDRLRREWGWTGRARARGVTGLGALRAGSSGDLPPPSPPAEKAAAREIFSCRPASKTLIIRQHDSITLVIFSG